jgi:hypothetical protein
VSSQLDPTAIRGMNHLAAQWAGRLSIASGNSTVLSGVGVWPLLAMLADGAAGAVRDELAAAIGIAPEHAAAQTQAALDVLRRSDQLHAALGVWVADHVPLDPDWTAKLATDMIGRLTGEPATDQPLLDAWASRHTDGLIKQLPVDVDRDTLLLLASALSIRLRWERKFTDSPRGISHGPWADTGRMVGLTRTTSDLDDLSIAQTPNGPLSLVTVRGVGDIDVTLVMGEPEQPASQVLSAAISSVNADMPCRVGSQLKPGYAAPGVQVREIDSVTPARILVLDTVGFDISGSHNLTEHAELFGLATARRARRGSFPGISAVDLAVGEAAQTAMATFSAEGFVAAAVTALRMMCGSAPSRQPKNAVTRLVEVNFDRPFGFMATHRRTGLVLMAGWVGRPQRWPEQLD